MTLIINNHDDVHAFWFVMSQVCTGQVLSQLSSLSDQTYLSLHKQLKRLPLSMLTVGDCLIDLKFKCWVILLTPKYEEKTSLQQIESMLFIIHHCPVQFPTASAYTQGHCVLSGRMLEPQCLCATGQCVRDYIACTGVLKPL